MNILIVDDVLTNCLILEKFLKGEGYQTFIARDGDEAVKIYQENMNTIQLILMDVMMPKMNGFLASQEIKKISQENNKYIPILIVSTLSSNEDYKQGYTVGVDDYITKPVNFDLLKTKLAMFKLIITQNDKVKENLFNIEQELLMAKRILDYNKKKQKKHPFIDSFQVSFNKDFNGDNIGCFTDGDIIRFFLSDAVGHGLPAALLNIIQEQFFYDTENHKYSFEDFVYHLNNQIYKTTEPMFYICSAFFECNLRTNKMKIINAGIPNILLENSIHVNSSNLPLGILENNTFEVFETNIYKTIVLSDGFTEIFPQTSFSACEFLFRNDLEKFLNEQFSKNVIPTDDLSFLYFNPYKKLSKE